MSASISPKTLLVNEKRRLVVTSEETVAADAIDIKNNEPKPDNIDTNESKTDTNIRIDTEALNGLRGILAVHIMIFHSFFYSKLQLNLLGSVQMSFFFLLSGYIFGLSEGKTKYTLTKCCTELKKFPETSDEKHFDGRHFYRRRIARTLPLYYLTNILCIPLVFGGYSWTQPDVGLIITSVMTLFVVTTWFGKPLLLNGPSWFVSTIWFFYWIFPSLLPKLQRYETKKKQKHMVLHYWIQLIVAVVLFIPLFVIGSSDAWFVATFWPPSRLPLFIMGVLAGLLRNEGIAMKASWRQYTVANWRQKCDILCIIFIFLFVAGSVVQNMFPFAGLHFWFQIILPWWMLQFISALTFDEGTSRTYKILASKCMLQLGRVSYALYLVHEPLIQYICWVVYGTHSMPSCDNSDAEGADDPCAEQWETWSFQRLMPNWCIPIHWLVSFIIALILNRCVEEPMRKWLRPPKKN